MILQRIQKAISVKYVEKKVKIAIAVGGLFLSLSFSVFYDPYLNSGQRIKIDTKWTD